MAVTKSDRPAKSGPPAKGRPITKVDWWAPQLLAVCCVLAYATASLGPLVSALLAGGALQVELPAQGASQPVAGLGSSRVEVTTGPSEIWRFDDPSALQWTAALLPPVLTCAVLAVGTWLLWRFLATVRGSDPFAQPRARRILLGAGVLVCVWALSLPFVRAAAGFMILIESGHNGFDFHLGGTELAGVGLGVVFGGVLICLAEVFRRGETMSDDLDGLV